RAKLVALPREHFGMVEVEDRAHCVQNPCRHAAHSSQLADRGALRVYDGTAQKRRMSGHLHGTGETSTPLHFLAVVWGLLADKNQGLGTPSPSLPVMVNVRFAIRTQLEDTGRPGRRLRSRAAPHSAPNRSLCLSPPPSAARRAQGRLATRSSGQLWRVPLSVP